MAPLQFPYCTNVQLALFPEAVSVFANEADFNASQAGRPTQYASSSLIPSGLFGDPPPRPEAIAAGTITGIKHHTNKLTGLPFISAAFDTFGGVYDLVLPNAADTKELAIGNIVFGRFWVSGKIIRQAVPPPLP